MAGGSQSRLIVVFRPGRLVVAARLCPRDLALQLAERPREGSSLTGRAVCWSG